MSTRKPTPGPWKAVTGGAAENTVIAEDGFIVATVNQFAASFGNKQDDANARLIAAAPELLHALQMLLGCVLTGGDPREGLGPAKPGTSPVALSRAAIARTTGKEPQP